MVQAAEYYLYNDVTLVWLLYGARYWRIPVERLMWTIRVVILEVLTENSNQMCFVQHDDVIKTFLSDTGP